MGRGRSAFGTRSRAVASFVAFVAPICVLYGVFFLYPLLAGTAYAFTEWNGIQTSSRFVGLRNFVALASDANLLNSARFTFTLAIMYLVGVNVVALSLAILLDRNMKGIGVARAVFFAPFIINLVTIGFSWNFILGRLALSLHDRTGWRIFGVSWLGDPNVVQFTVLMVKMWQAVGYYMVIYLAGLQTIPEELVESAHVEGASGTQQVFRIKIPLLTPAFTVCSFLSLTDILQVFALLLTLTGGGPGRASESIALNIYTEAFQMLRFGYASAKAFVFLAVIVTLTFVQLAFFRKRTVEL